MTVMGSSSGSSGACNYSMVVSWLVLRSMLVSGITVSSSASSVAWSLLRGSCGVYFTLLSEASLSTPVIYMSLIGRPLQSVNIKLFGSFQASLLTRDIRVVRAQDDKK